MKKRAVLLVVLAAAPFCLLVRHLDDAWYAWFPGGSRLLYLLTGAVWCCLYIYTWRSAPPRWKKGVLWMSPLALFAFAIPAFYLYLAVGFWWAINILHRAPP